LSLTRSGTNCLASTVWSRLPVTCLPGSCASLTSPARLLVPLPLASLVPTCSSVMLSATCIPTLVHSHASIMLHATCLIASAFTVTSCPTCTSAASMLAPCRIIVLSACTSALPPPWSERGPLLPPAYAWTSPATSPCLTLSCHGVTSCTTPPPLTTTLCLPGGPPRSNLLSPPKSVPSTPQPHVWLRVLKTRTLMRLSASSKQLLRLLKPRAASLPPPLTASSVRGLALTLC
jgi:hypothetical protein